MFAGGVNFFLHSRTLVALLCYIIIHFIFLFGVWCGELFISVIYSFLLFYNDNSIIAQIIVLGRYVALKRAFKNCELWTVC